MDADDDVVADANADAGFLMAVCCDSIFSKIVFIRKRLTFLNIVVVIVSFSFRFLFFQCFTNLESHKY